MTEMNENEWFFKNSWNAPELLGIDQDWYQYYSYKILDL